MLLIGTIINMFDFNLIFLRVCFKIQFSHGKKHTHLSPGEWKSNKPLNSTGTVGFTIHWRERG